MHTLLDPTLLFFVFGLFAGLIRSNLEIPAPVSKFLSLYLLMALGLKGGFALAASDWNATMAGSLAAAMFMALLVPVVGYQILKHRVGRLDAAAIAASYGSVSAVTFVTAVQHLETLQIGVAGHMVVAMVLMESPAIVVAVVLAAALRQTAAPVTVSGSGTATLAARPGPGPFNAASIGRVLHESLTNGSHLLLLGALVIGAISGEAGKAAMAPFSEGLFKGLLAFFLLDMGLTVARHLPSTKGASPTLLAYATLGPLAHAAVALALAALLGLPEGDAALLMVLSASASYIVVPAVLRHAIPEANPSLYFGLALGVTFPMNLLLGIPMYIAAARAVLGT